jgi:hypothetical protein
MERNRFRTEPLRAEYLKPRWRAMREATLRQYPLCVRCLSQGLYRPSTVADHVREHDGDLEAFYHGPTVGLCGSCHSWKNNVERNPGRVRELHAYWAYCDGLVAQGSVDA